MQKKNTQEFVFKKKNCHDVQNLRNLKHMLTERRNTVAIKYLYNSIVLLRVKPIYLTSYLRAERYCYCHHHGAIIFIKQYTHTGPYIS